MAHAGRTPAGQQLSAFQPPVCVSKPIDGSHRELPAQGSSLHRHVASHRTGMRLGPSDMASTHGVRPAPGESPPARPAVIVDDVPSSCTARRSSHGRPAIGALGAATWLQRALRPQWCEGGRLRGAAALGRQLDAVSTAILEGAVWHAGSCESRP